MRESLTLHSSWRGLVASYLGASILFAAGVAAVVSSSGATGAWIVVGIGALLVVGVTFDVPISTEFDREGVTRRPLLRRHRLAWDDVGQLTRARPGIAAAARNLNPGGLTAKVGRRRYLLVDQCESRAEFDALVEMLADASDVDIGVDDLLAPPQGIDPTWTYRRKRWQPQFDR